MKFRFALLCILSCPAFAADYYVTPNGNDSGPGSKSLPWQTITKANAVLQPGDTAYVAPGEYRQRIEPARSGQKDKYITYRAYEGRPVITNPPGRVAITLTNKSYIRITGFGIDGKGAFTKSNIDSFVQMNGGGWNIIENGDFKNAKGWAGVSLQNTHYNKLLNNRIDQVGAWVAPKPTGPAEGVGDMITMHCANYNLIEGNHLTRGGHTLIANNGNYNVIRKNLFDQKWGEGIGYRAMELTANKRFCAKTVGYSLTEHNTFKNMLKAPSKDETTGFKVEGEGHIVRFNTIDQVAGPATTCVIRPPIILNCQHNRIYNNTFKDAKVIWEYRKYGEGDAFDNILKNNQLINTAQAIVQGTNISLNNLAGTNVVDKGIFLTETTSDGDGTTIPVKDAHWFTDGFGVVAGDRLQVGSNPPIRLVAVNYSANTLTFEKPLRWGKGDRVGLPYSGKGPDVGAIAELGDTTPDPGSEQRPAPPTSLQIIRSSR
jgi:hypothetical protein